MYHEGTMVLVWYTMVRTRNSYSTILCTMVPSEVLMVCTMVLLWYTMVLLWYTMVRTIVFHGKIESDCETLIQSVVSHTQIRGVGSTTCVFKESLTVLISSSEPKHEVYRQ